MSCKHIRAEFVVPGWGCCQCQCYNGYQREVCRNCGHVPCYTLEGTLGKEALELKPIGSNPKLVGEWIERRGLSNGN